MKNNVLYYSVGPLLYCPANRISITDSLINERFGNRFSLALCLEDTINDDHVEEAEQILISSLSQIFIQHEPVSPSRNSARITHKVILSR